MLHLLCSCLLQYQSLSTILKAYFTYLFSLFDFSTWTQSTRAQISLLSPILGFYGEILVPLLFWRSERVFFSLGCFLQCCNIQTLQAKHDGRARKLLSGGASNSIPTAQARRLLAQKISLQCQKAQSELGCALTSYFQLLPPMTTPAVCPAFTTLSLHLFSVLSCKVSAVQRSISVLDPQQNKSSVRKHSKSLHSRDKERSNLLNS